MSVLKLRRTGNTLLRANYEVDVPPGGGGDFNSSMPGCVCPKVKDMGPFFGLK